MTLPLPLSHEEPQAPLPELKITFLRLPDAGRKPYLEQQFLTNAPAALTLIMGALESWSHEAESAGSPMFVIKPDDASIALARFDESASALSKTGRHDQAKTDLREALQRAADQHITLIIERQE